jgi:hypothetical protein
MKTRTFILAYNLVLQTRRKPERDYDIQLLQCMAECSYEEAQSAYDLAREMRVEMGIWKQDEIEQLAQLISHLPRGRALLVDNGDMKIVHVKSDSNDSCKQ